MIEDSITMNASEVFLAEKYPKDNAIYMVEDEYGAKSLTYKNGNIVYNMMIPKDLLISDVPTPEVSDVKEKSGIEDILKVIAVCNKPELVFKGE